MRSVRFALLLFFLVLITVPVRAQQPLAGSPLVVEDQKAVSLLHASLSALLYSTATPPTTIVASGTITLVWDSAAVPHPVRVHVKDTDKFRWEEDFPQGMTATVIDGQTLQSQSSSTGTPLMPWQVGVKRLENFPVLLLTSWLASSNMQFHFVGLEAVDGQDLYHISIIDLSQKMRPQNPWHRDEHRGESDLYVDPATSYPVRLHYYQETSDTIYFSLAPVEMVYSDFRVTGGAVFPFTLTRYRGDKKIAVLQLQTIRPNNPVSDQDFKTF
jgi:hypothetical protein